ncbi:hypothetical protein MVEN_01109900 [Mycena venus]|uniref:F-box domain-containing protein n=1 Tax=Mycena venus TaxID=2733690 RepID=A0A8H7CZU2_9AGAR|nr:hypothetical protein MVEN_01109900 [Mycena venus]
MPTIFALLSGVRRLVISFRGDPLWNRFTDDARAAFCSILALPSLRCVGFFRCTNVPAALIRHALSDYEEVALIVTELDPADPRISLLCRNQSRPTATLHHLAIENSKDPDALLILVMDEMEASLRWVKRVELSLTEPGTLDGLEKIAVRCSPTLEHLVVNLNDFHNTRFDLPKLPNLRCLTLTANAKRLRVPVAMQDVITTLPKRMHHLEVLNIIVKAQFEDYHHYRPDREMDEALKNLPCLRDVHFSTSLSNSAWKKYEFDKDMTIMLPMANDAGLLSFSKWSSRRRYHRMIHFSN